MKSFINDETFLLENEQAQRLYHEYAKEMPIIDYHCHLSPADLANDRKFDSLTQAWLEGDHYKWRAMRTNGINEKYCTGNASDYAKFEKWAETVPYTLRNPLYHWTHLELKRYFDIDQILNPASAKDIYEEATEKLRDEDYSCRNLVERMQVKVICTTDDPLDSLEHHKMIAASDTELQVLPTFRPDKAMTVHDAKTFNDYVDQLAHVANMDIARFDDYIDALKKRHDYFHEQGCRLSDHGLEQIATEEFYHHEIVGIFFKIRAGHTLSPQEQRKFQSAMLMYFGIWDHEKKWTQQFHLGALRNNSTRMMKTLGPDTGFDSIGDFTHARELSKFLDKLDTENTLAKTILYNLNPADNYLFASMAGNFNDGSIPGKIQFGSGWWFLDQKEGMEWQMNALSNLGLISRFVGMLTDSRSFLSYPRHEYFRRILCNLFGTDMYKGVLPDDMDWIGQIIQNICYHNAKSYFNF